LGCPQFLATKKGIAVSVLERVRQVGPKTRPTPRAAKLCIALPKRDGKYRNGFSDALIYLKS
jgi:hypothetical protein